MDKYLAAPETPGWQVGTATGISYRRARPTVSWLESLRSQRSGVEGQRGEISLLAQDLGRLAMPILCNISTHVKKQAAQPGSLNLRSY